MTTQPETLSFHIGEASAQMHITGVHSRRLETHIAETKIVAMVSVYRTQANNDWLAPIPGDRVLDLCRIDAQPLGTRRGKIVMQYLCKQADLAGIHMVLDVVATPGRDCRKLIAYYETFGLIETSTARMKRAIKVSPGSPDQWLTNMLANLG
jgi:hypothetical protein